MILQPLPAGFDATRDAIHGYARVVGELARAHAIAHPNWWHLGLRVRPDGLVTVPLPLPDGGAMAVRLDLAAGVAEAVSSRGDHLAVGLDGVTPGDLADRLAGFAAGCAPEGGLDLSRIPEGAGDPDWEVAAAYAATLVDIDRTLERHRVTLGLAAGPIVVWPHGFDLAFEWFGTRRVTGEDGDTAAAQLNLGFSPHEGGYFYSNPWPFDQALTGAELPPGASWHVVGWQGTMLPYAEVAGSEDGAERVVDYATAVHRIARPTLMA